MKLAHALLALPLICSSLTQAAVIEWVGTQSDQVAINDAASFHDGVNWFNFIPPGENDVAVLGSGFDPQDNGTLPHNLYFGRFQTQYFPPSPGGDGPPIPAHDRTIHLLDIRSGTDWVFNFGTNIVHDPDFEGQTHGSLTVQQSIHLANPGVAPTVELLVIGGKLKTNGPLHVAGIDGLASGTLIVRGDQAEFEAAYVDLGLTGEGTIRLEEGASLTASSSFGPLWIGIFDGSRGHLVATGGSSVFGGGVLGREIGSYGTATISGGSSWTMAQDAGVGVGFLGSGDMQIQSGGYVEGGASIGVGEQSDSSATVTGDGSSWNVRGVFAIGGSGRAALHVLNDGHVLSEDVIMGWNSGSTAVAEVDGGASWEVNGNDVTGRAGTLVVGIDGSAELTVGGHGVVAVRRELRIGAQGSVDVGTSGIVNIGEGDVPDAGTLRIGPAGILSGTGVVIGDVLVDGGTVSPGASPGALHINGDFHQAAGSLLTMEIGGTNPGAQYDQLLVMGELLLEGTVRIEFINGFVPQIGDKFDLFTASSAQIIGPLTFMNAPSDFRYSSSFKNGVFAIAVVPEPTTVVLLSVIGSAVVLSMRRRNSSAIAVIFLALGFSLHCNHLQAQVFNPANGHYYEYVDQELTWEEARQAAELRTFGGVNGYLATITSQSEQDFLASTFIPQPGWLGGLQTPGSVEPGEGWTWITGEPFVYLNWGQFEPNNAFGDNPNENRLAFVTDGHWNDAPDIFTTRFFVEYNVPEPATVVMILFGVVGVMALRRPRDCHAIDDRIAIGGCRD